MCIQQDRHRVAGELYQADAAQKVVYELTSTGMRKYLHMHCAQSNFNKNHKQYMKITLRVLIVLVLAVVLIGFYWLGGAEVVSLASIKAGQQELLQQFSQSPLLFASLFFVVYLISAALSLPMATLLTVLAGGIFGFWPGLVLVSFASTLGATIAFLLSRFVFREYIQNRYMDSLQKINVGWQKDGPYYLLALRLVPAFPFFMVNLTMGILPVTMKQFYLLSQVGMLPGTAVYVYAGTELGKINTLADITSPSLLLALTLLGMFPLLTKRLVQRWHT